MQLAARKAECSDAAAAHARTIPGKQQLVINAFAKALEVTLPPFPDIYGASKWNVLKIVRVRR